MAVRPWCRPGEWRRADQVEVRRRRGCAPAPVRARSPRHLGSEEMAGGLRRRCACGRWPRPRPARPARATPRPCPSSWATGSCCATRGGAHEVCRRGRLGPRAHHRCPARGSRSTEAAVLARVEASRPVGLDRHALDPPARAAGDASVHRGVVVVERGYLVGAGVGRPARPASVRRRRAWRPVRPAPALRPRRRPRPAPGARPTRPARWAPRRLVRGRRPRSGGGPHPGGRRRAVHACRRTRRPRHQPAGDTRPCEVLDARGTTRRAGDQRTFLAGRGRGRPDRPVASPPGGVRAPGGPHRLQSGWPRQRRGRRVRFPSTSATSARGPDLSRSSLSARDEPVRSPSDADLRPPRTDVTQRLAERAARAPRSPVRRRSFLARSAMAGTALAAAPATFALKPRRPTRPCGCSGSNCACSSTCCDGYTEFCCTLAGKPVSTRYVHRRVVEGGRLGLLRWGAAATTWTATPPAAVWMGGSGICGGCARAQVRVRDGVAATARPGVWPSATASATSRSPASVRSSVGSVRASPLGDRPHLRHGHPGRQRHGLPRPALPHRRPERRSTR